MSRCDLCGVAAERHGAACDPARILEYRLLADALDAHTATAGDVSEKALREARLQVDLERAARGEYPFPYPPEWDREDDEPEPRFEWRVTHKRVGWKRSHSKTFQRLFYARRRFRRLARSSGRAGLAPIEELRLEVRDVGEWETERDEVTRWYR